MADPAAYLIRSGATLALFYAFYWLVLRRETFFALNRAYLLGAAVLSLGLPLLRVPSPFVRNYFDNSYQELVSFFAKDRDMNVSELEEILTALREEIKKQKAEQNG